MTDSFVSFGFGTNDDFTTELENFKGQKGRTYRWSFTNFPGIMDASFGVNNLTPKTAADKRTLSPVWEGAYRSYIEKVGYVVNKDDEFTRLAGKEPKPYGATTIVVWPLDGDDDEDDLNMEIILLKKPKVYPLVVDASKYNTFKKFHKGTFKMYEWDIKAECKDGSWQKFEYSPAEKCIFAEVLKLASSDPRAKKIADFVIAQTRIIVPKLRSRIAQDLSIEDVKEKLGIGQPQATAVETVSSADQQAVEDMVDELLES